jgi:DNA helicase-2/ATP-dependent DNA helicase PcrA
VEISFSRLRIHRECPWKYKLQFVDGKRPPLDAPSSLGVSLHRALERWHRGGDPSWETLADAYEAEFLRAGYADAAERARWSKRGRRMLERYHEADQSRRTQVLASEKEFVYALGAHSVRGMIDRLDRRPDGRVEVVDYKTREGAAWPDLQLRFYAMGARRGLGLDVAAVTVHYLADDKTETRPYDPAGEAELEALILETAEAIEAGRFGPDTTFCPRCVFKRDCQHSIAT